MQDGRGPTIASGALTSNEGRAFFRERLVLTAGALFGLSFGFYVLMNLAYSTLPDHGAAAWIDARGNTWHLASTGALAAIALVARSIKAPSATLLSALDAGLVLAPSAGFWLVGMDLSPTWPGAHIALLAIANVVMARAILVPSTGGRTLVLTILAAAPVILLEHLSAGPTDAPQLVRTVAMALWTIVPIAIATITSAVIYGLTQQVREARRLGQYTLTERIGAGAMGEVHKAKHALLRREAALKLIASHQASEETLHRFELEVQHTAELTHPNTISIYDYGRTPEGVLYYVMEYLDGVDLETLVDTDGPQPPGRVVSILRQVCSAIAEAHDRGLIHRDLKPANVMLCVRGGELDVVKVLDFGLVTQVGGDPSKSSETLLGTPHYMAPEAIRAPTEIDAKVDLYAIGAIGYFLLSGKTVFDAEEVPKILRAHLESTVVPPSTRLGLPLPEELERVLCSCLAKEPSERPANARKLRALLGTSTDETWSDEESEKWWTEWRKRQHSKPRMQERLTLDIDFGDREPKAEAPVAPARVESKRPKDKGGAKKRKSKRPKGR